MNNQAPSNPPPIPWPLTFDSFSFDARCFNTLACSIIFHGQQHALDSELEGPSGEPNSSDWKDKWTAGLVIPEDRMPPGPVQIRWTSLDGAAHAAEIDLIKDIFPDQRILHDVQREEVWEFWNFDSLGHSPEILLEINDRTITVYMSSFIMTRTWVGEGDSTRRVARSKLSEAWTKTY